MLQSIEKDGNLRKKSTTSHNFKIRLFKSINSSPN